MSVDMNSVTIIGRLTRDAELKHTSGGLAVSRFSIAVNRRKKNGDNWEDEASFIDVTLFGKSAESVNQYLTKGKQIAIKGELHQDRWEQDGQARSKVGIIAESVQLLGGGENARGGAQTGSGGESRQGHAPGAGAGQGGGSAGGSRDDFADDIPF
jgi:single-strand DNA-binding protein